MVKIRKSLLFKPVDKSISRKISIVTPGKFDKSIKALMRRGLTVKENKALVSARNIAAVQLKRKDLSKRERNQFRAISTTVIPRASR